MAASYNPARVNGGKSKWDESRNLRMSASTKWHEVFHLSKILQKARSTDLTQQNNKAEFLRALDDSGMTLDQHGVGPNSRFPADLELVSEDNIFFQSKLTPLRNYLSGSDRRGYIYFIIAEMLAQLIKGRDIFNTKSFETEFRLEWA